MVAAFIGAGYYFGMLFSYLRPSYGIASFTYWRAMSKPPK